MKHIVFTILFAALFVACDNVTSDDNPVISPNSTPDLTQIRIKERPSEKLEYVGEIGGDFDTALDSLRKLKGISSEIIKEPLEVIFDFDDRLFFGISYGDCGMYSDVLDTKGNYYLRTWYCSEGNNAEIQEDALFNENKTFTIGNGGSYILYQSRIGNDFDSALDSLINSYEPLLKTLVTEGHYSGEGFNIVKERINVNFSYDNRAFVFLTFIDKANIYQYLFTGDVIDEKGNFYRLIECED